MVLANLDALKSRGKCWLVRTAATTLLVALLVVSMARWLYFLGRIGRALFDWISPSLCGQAFSPQDRRQTENKPLKPGAHQAPLIAPMRPLALNDNYLMMFLNDASV